MGSAAAQHSSTAATNRRAASTVEKGAEAVEHREGAVRQQLVRGAAMFDQDDGIVCPQTRGMEGRG
jgi:hypothetical protein